MAAGIDMSSAVAVFGFVPRQRKYERAGLAFEANWVSDRLALGHCPSPIIKVLNGDANGNSNSNSSSNSDEEDDDSLFDAEDEKYFKYLNKLNPTEWKKQDHYRVLGITKLRNSATEGQIRRAYRSKLINHHPDKRRGKGLAVKDDKEDYFTCITRAYEQLSVPIKRRSYDSCDPKFDNTIPTEKQIKSMDCFYKLFEPVFARNARWSTLRDVPELGDADSSHDHVEQFYSFWFDFQTWREYSYEDEEETEKGENRAERRWLDKENKKVRQDKRADEVKRVRSLVDLAYANDPRVVAFKAEQKAMKNAYKNAKKDAVKAKKLAEEQELAAKLEHERIAKEQAAAEAKAKSEAEKKERERKKKLLRAERKKLRQFMEGLDFLSEGQSDVRAINEDAVQRICDHFTDSLKLADLVERLTTAENTCETFVEETCRIDIEIQRIIDPHGTSKPMFNGAASPALTPKTSVAKLDWSDEEVKLLIKATALFPVGTQSRWQVIAEFINDHNERSNAVTTIKTAKGIIAKAKEFQSNDSHKAPMSEAGLVQNKRLQTVTAPESKRNADNNGSPLEESNTEKTAWSADEQKLLEQALKTHDASTADRWDRIAECIPGRNKKECVKRYKELAEMIKSKKAAQVKVNGAK